MLRGILREACTMTSRPFIWMAPPCVELQSFGVVAVGEESGCQRCAGFVVGLVGDDAGAGSVAEEDGGVGVGIGDAAGHDLRGDNEDVAVARGEVGGEGDGDERACTGDGNVDGWSRREAEFCARTRGRAGKARSGEPEEKRMSPMSLAVRLAFARQAVAAARPRSATVSSSAA